MSGHNGKLFRFGIFELDTATAGLSRNGARVRLQEQPARVLQYLLENHGSVVTREELQRTLWPEDTFVDFDHGLNTTVNKIRDALGDSASNPRFVATVPRKGYRFIAPVEVVGTAAPAAVPERAPRRWNWLAIAGGVCVVLGIAAAWFQFMTNVPPLPVVTPLTTLPGAEMSPSLSPDGDRVAFHWEGPAGDNADVYVKQIGSEQLLRITTNAAADVGPVWSPDGRLIAFARIGSGTNRELMVVPSMGGAERKITDFHATDGRVRKGAGSWGPDSRWLVISDLATAGHATNSLHWVSVETGERREITSPPANVMGDRDPAVSPDGSEVAFVRIIAQDTSDLLLMPVLGGKAPVRLLQQSQLSNQPAWTPDGKELIFQTGPVLIPRLARLRVGSERAVILDLAGEFAFGPSLSSRGHRLSFARLQWNPDIWVHSIGTKGVGATRRWAGSSTYLDHVPRYSPDGRKVALISSRDGMTSLWVSDADGANTVRLSGFKDQDITGVSWTPDSNRIAARTSSKGYSFDVRNGAVRPLPAAGWLSRDGQWLYYIGKNTGRNEIWRVRPGGGSQTQVTRNGGVFAVDSVDGRFLYYTQQQENSALWRVPISGGTEEKILDAVSTAMNFDVTEDGVYFIPPIRAGEKSRIQFLRLRNREVENVTEFEGTPLWGFSVSPDRRSILFARLGDLQCDLMLVDNFR